MFSYLFHNLLINYFIVPKGKTFETKDDFIAQYTYTNNDVNELYLALIS